jgi:hypothetical protein
MATERQAIPEAKVTDGPVGIEQAWDNLVKAGQEEAYKKMDADELKELREKIERGEPPGEGMEEIADYVKAVDDYLSRVNS